jgi:hypothetical protein
MVYTSATRDHDLSSRRTKKIHFTTKSLTVEEKWVKDGRRLI